MLSNNYFRVLYGGYTDYLRSYRVYIYESYIYNLLCGYDVAGANSRMNSADTDNRSVFVGLIRELSRVVGFLAYNVNSVVVKGKSLRFDFSSQESFFTRREMVPASRNFFSLRTLFRGVLGLDGESVEYSTGSP